MKGHHLRHSQTHESLYMADSLGQHCEVTTPIFCVRQNSLASLLLILLYLVLTLHWLPSLHYPIVEIPPTHSTSIVTRPGSQMRIGLQLSNDNPRITAVSTQEPTTHTVNLQAPSNTASRICVWPNSESGNAVWANSSSQVSVWPIHETMSQPK